jgi:tRNA(Ile)-lysidine synthase
MALLGLLGLLAHGERLEVFVGHVDHGLRPGSAEEAAMVCDVARARGLECSVTRLTLHGGPGLPARARDARRAALLAQCAAVGGRAIALGHTATDQAETVLLHLARGAGLDGLSAMPSIAVGPEPFTWVRPLIALTRADTRLLAQRLELPFVDDPTNTDPKAPRIAMRDRVLPVLRELNPNADRALAAVADRAREADHALGVWIDRELARRMSTVHDVERWSVEGLSGLPSAVRRGLVREICRRAGVPADALGRRVMDGIDEALAHPGAPHGWDLHGGRRLRLQHKILWLEVPARDGKRDEDG